MLCCTAIYGYIIIYLIFCSIQSLDRGGAITGRPSGRQQQQQQQQQQQARVASPVPSGASSASGDAGVSIKQKILNSLNVGYAITGPPAAQPSNKYWSQLMFSILAPVVPYRRPGFL